VAQLGSGNNSHYPNAIDTRQFFQNAAAAMPDSSTRLDAEIINDLLSAMINVQTTLGANPQGVHGSVAARLNTFLPGGSGTQGLLAFVETTSLTVSGTQTTPTLPGVLYQVYSNEIPGVALEVESARVALGGLNYTLTLGFGQAQSGSLVVTTGTPQFTKAFTGQTSVSIPNSEHQLAAPWLIFQCYDAATPAQAIQPETFQINGGTADVTVTFGQPQSGSIVLAALTPVFHYAFSAVQGDLTIPGSTHLLATAALLYQVYGDIGSGTYAAMAPERVTLDPNTYDITFSFPQATTGYLVLVPASTVTGTDFNIQDSGIPNNTAVRVYSRTGALLLQPGSFNNIYFMERLGATVRMVLDTLNTRLGVGVTSPTHTLHLGTDDAAKTATSTWTTTSDERLKEVLGPFTEGLAALMQLEPVRFRYNGLGGVPRDGKEHVSLLAQAVQAVAPYMVDSHPGQLTPDGPEEAIYTLNLHAMTFLFVNAIQELCQRVVALETQVAQLVEARRNADTSLW
jgi:hypothetical protein